jgi:phytanoyl-CoA hydroxylase
MTTVIGERRKAFWDRYGFLVLPGFFWDDEVIEVQRLYDQVWERCPPEVVVDDLATNRRLRISDAGGSLPHDYVKVNDLYLTEPALRSVVLSDRLGMVLGELLGDEPTICNSLNFSKGSQQPDHLDTLFMPPQSDGGLVATWMALEDTADDAGPLRYFPESNHIEPYRFSTGSFRICDPEMPKWSDYMAEQVARRGLAERRFLAHRGELFIWGAFLLHGGCEIKDPALTRRSVVTHYWRQTDCEAMSLDLRPCEGGWWINRPPLAVTAEKSSSPESAELADIPASMSSGSAGRPELRDRLDALNSASN